MARGTESEEQMHGRIEEAKREVELVEKLPYFEIKLINDDFKTFYTNIKKILQGLYPQFEFCK